MNFKTRKYILRKSKKNCNQNKLKKGNKKICPTKTKGKNTHKKKSLKNGVNKANNKISDKLE